MPHQIRCYDLEEGTLDCVCPLGEGPDFVVDPPDEAEIAMLMEGMSDD